MTKSEWQDDDVDGIWRRTGEGGIEYLNAADVNDYIKRKDTAYEERNKLVAALARLFDSGVTKTNIEGWSPDWHGCVYIDLPTGQVSWHFHDSQAYLFEGLPSYTKPWDGHDTEEKYRRLASLGWWGQDQWAKFPASVKAGEV